MKWYRDGSVILSSIICRARLVFLNTVHIFTYLFRTQTALLLRSGFDLVHSRGGFGCCNGGGSAKQFQQFVAGTRSS